MAESAASMLGLLGDFSGGPGSPLAARSWRSVDPDTFDDVIRAFDLRLELELDFCEELALRCWRDFHPDSIAERVPQLRLLLEARTAVDDPQQMRNLLDEAGVEVSAAPTGRSPAARPAAAAASPPAGGHDDASLLDAMLDSPQSQEQPAGSSRDPGFDKLVREIVDQTEAPDFERQDAWQRAIDAELARRMRAILHHPLFSSVEASWRSAREIVRAAASGESPGIRLLDLRIDEVTADAQLEFSASALYQLVCATTVETPGADGFALLLGGFQIDDTAAGLAAARHLAAIADRIDAPFIADAGPALGARGSAASADWQALRDDRLGRRLALLYPRVLIRLPYGRETEPIDAFEFDEVPAGAEPAPLLWGSTALAVGRELARALSGGGDGTFGRLEGLPLWIRRDAGEVTSVGPLEELLSEPNMKELIDAGIAPLAGVVGTDSAQLVAFRSISGESLV